MSLQSNMAVMRAKLAGNTPQLIALAQQGDFEAAAALKEMMDKKAYAQSVADQTAMGQPDTLPVLEQMAGNLDAPQSGLAAYAGGGLRRGFFDGGSAGLDFREGEGILDRAGRRVKTGFTSLIDLLRLPSQDEFKGGPPRAAEPPVSPEYPERAGMLHPPKGKVSQLQPKGGYTGIAAAAAPRESSGPPQKSQPVPPAQILEGPPPAEELGDKELLAATEKLTTLQKERDALRDKSRAQLEAAYNEKVKALTPSKFDKIMTFLAGVQGHGGRSAAQALGAGAQKMHGLEKASQAQLAAAKEAWARADLLEQQAMVADRMKDVEGAMALRKEALELRRQAKKDEAATGLQKSQAGLANANAEYVRSIKPIVEGKKADAAVTRAGRSGIAGGAGGIKPKDYSTRVQAAYNGLKSNLAYIDKTDDELRELARQHVDVDLARAGGKTAAASPASPSVKFLGFE